MGLNLCNILCISAGNNCLNDLALDRGGCVKNLGFSANNCRISKRALYGFNTCNVLCVSACNISISKLAFNGLYVAIGLLICLCNLCIGDGLSFGLACIFFCRSAFFSVGRGLSRLACLLGLAISLCRFFGFCAFNLVCIDCFLNGLSNDSSKNGI